MLQNLKIDIIYYNTPSDFEFEFNLGGYCRNARILNSRTGSAKDTVAALAKAVNRSRIIIMVGQLNDDDGLIAYVSKAISRKTVLINNNEYNIASDEKYYVCDGALPLVTKGGAFGGCIVESGPQSIIMLDGNKSLRNEIMEQLVYTYLVSISRMPDAENDLIDSSATAKAEDSNTAQIEEKDVISLPDEMPSADSEPAVAQESEISEQYDAVEDTEITEETEIENEQEVSQDSSTAQKADNSLNIETSDSVLEQTQDTPIISMEPTTIINTESAAEFITTTEDFNSFEATDETENDSIITSDESHYVEDAFITTSDTFEFDDSTVPAQENTEPELQEANNINSYEDIYSGIDYGIDDDSTESKNTENKSKSSKALKNAMFIIAALLLIVCALLTYFIVYVPMSNDISVVTYLKEIFNL